jgi:hypothetical protein
MDNFALLPLSGEYKPGETHTVSFRFSSDPAARAEPPVTAPATAPQP